MSAASSRPAYWGEASTYLFQHRAFVRLPDGRGRMLRALALGLVLTAAWLAVLPLVLRGWTAFLVGVNALAGHPGTVVVTAHRWGALDVPVPHLSVVSAEPSLAGWMTSVLLILALVWAAPRLPDRLTPLAYGLRALALIHLTALVAFAVARTGLYTFPYNADAMLGVLAHVTLVVATCVPLVLALVYFVQDVTLGHKLALTALTLGFLAVFLPVLTAFHALVLEATSLVWLPLLFLAMGVPLVVFLAIGLYALGMSWGGPLLDRAPEAAPWQPGHPHLRATGRLDGPPRARRTPRRFRVRARA